VILAGIGLAFTASAASEAQKSSAIVNGLAHLAYVQCSTAANAYIGSWSTPSNSANGNNCALGYNDAYTGAALFALLTQKSHWPAANTYTANVAAGIAYLLSTASTGTVTANSNNVNICPGGTGSCTSVYWNTCGSAVYCTGFVSAAIDIYALTQGASTVASTTGPLANMTWVQIAQGITNAYASSQSTVANNTRNGGWRYSITSAGDADMSTTQWGAIAAGYDETVGAVTPAVLKSGLITWLAYDENLQGGPGGSACYYGGTSCSIGPTNSENGAWLVSNSYSGNTLSPSGELNFLNLNWKTAISGTWYGNFGHTYAMWSTYKGLEAAIGLTDNTHISNLMTHCGAEDTPAALPGSGICNWWEDYNEWLVNQSGMIAVDGGAVGATPGPGGGTTTGGGNKYWTGSTATGEPAYLDPLSTAVFTAIIGAAPLPSTITQTTPTVPAISRWGLVALGIMLTSFAAMKIRGTHTA